MNIFNTPQKQLELVKEYNKKYNWGFTDKHFKAVEKIPKQIENKDGELEAVILVPYCDMTQDLEHTDVGYEQDDETEYTCHDLDCGKKFIIISQVSYSWSTQVPDDEALDILEKELKDNRMSKKSNNTGEI